MQQNKFLIVVLFLVVVFGFWVFQENRMQPIFGSVSVTDEYLATSTAQYVDQYRYIPAKVLGSVVIVKTGTATIDIYDGNSTATSTYITKLPASLAVGTYVFDSALKYGLVLVFSSTDIATTTVTYR